MAKSRRERRKRKGRAASSASGRWIEVELEEVEIARGSDGLLRGRPEPALLIGVYAVNGAPSCLLGRALRRITLSGPLPAKHTPRAEDRLLVGRSMAQQYSRLVIVVVAAELDGAEDMERLCAALAEPEHIRLWDARANVPEVLSLDQAAQAEPAPEPMSRAVQLMVRGQHAVDLFAGDDYVSACVSIDGVDASVQRSLRFVSADERNDWSAVLRIRA